METHRGFVKSGEAKIYFEIAGEGDAIVFIHAGVADSRMWDPQFEKFARRFKVVRYDHRGFGKSSFPEGPFALREDLANVLRHLGLDSAVLVGCSMGGGTAIDFVLEHPQMVRGLVLVGSGVSGFFDPKNISAETLKHFTDLLALLQKGDVDAACEKDSKYWIDGPSRDVERIAPAYRERARQLHRENFSTDGFTRQETVLNPPAIERLGEIAAPTLVVIGDNDSEDLVKLAARMAKEIGGAKLVTIDNAAHLPSLEHPDEFNRLLEDFLAALSGQNR